MGIIEILRNRNRTLLEVDTGALFWTLMATAAGMAIPWRRWEMGWSDWCPAIWTAGILVMISLLHMQRCLERALDFDEGNASKLVARGYLTRYASLGLILIVSALTDVLNPLILCLAYLFIMKVAVYSQPFTHKLYNRLFRETEPDPLAEETLEAGNFTNKEKGG